MTGVGIPSNKLEAIFEMFTQINRSLPRSQGGLGDPTCAHEASCRPARRFGRGLERRARPRQRIRRPLAAREPQRRTAR